MLPRLDASAKLQNFNSCDQNRKLNMMKILVMVLASVSIQIAFADDDLLTRRQNVEPFQGTRSAEEREYLTKEAQKTITHSSASIVPIRAGCFDLDCRPRHAVVFVHGIYGGEETFVYSEGSFKFDWPRSVPETIAGEPVDVFLLHYETNLFTWVKKDIASFDEVVTSIYFLLEDVRNRGYKSVNFVAHSLGGNLVTAYMQSLKNTVGHPAIAQIGFVLTLGTPRDGAAIANVGLILKDMLGMNDPLLESLKKDNTFLRMMNLWFNLRAYKTDRYGCRPPQLFVGVESKPMGPIQVVDTESATYAARAGSGGTVDILTFPLNHSQIAKPKGTDDDIYKWFIKIFEGRKLHFGEWPDKPCGNQRWEEFNSWPTNPTMYLFPPEYPVKTKITTDLCRLNPHQCPYLP